MDDSPAEVFLLFVSLVVFVVGAFWAGTVAGRRFEQEDRAYAECVERCKPRPAVFAFPNCGCGEVAP